MGVINSRSEREEMKAKIITISVNGDKTTLTLDEALTIRDTLIKELVELGEPIYFDSEIICTAYEGLFDSCYVLHKHDCEK